MTFGIYYFSACCCFFQHSYFCNLVTSFNTVTFAMLLLTSSVACIVTCGSETSKMSNLGHRHKKQKGKRTAPKHSSVQSFQGYHLQVVKQVGLRNCQKQEGFLGQPSVQSFQGHHLQVLKQVGLRNCQKQERFLGQQQAFGQPIFQRV